MSELEEQINRILSDPAQMEKLSGLASLLMGGESGAAAPPPAPNLDPGLLQKLGRLPEMSTVAISRSAASACTGIYARHRARTKTIDRIRFRMGRPPIFYGTYGKEKQIYSCTV